MTYLLDTNTCIAYLNGRSQNVANKMQQKKPSDIVLCSVVKSELWYGAMKSQAPKKVLANLKTFFAPFISLVFDDSAAQCFSDIRADLAKKGTPIGPYDLQIAAIALANDLVVVTHNTREFERVQDLEIEDWHT